MNNLEFFICEPVSFNDLCYIYPVKVKDIITNTNFGIYEKILTIFQEDIEDELIENKIQTNDILNPFEYILNNAYNNDSFKQYLKEAFLFFTHEEIMILFEEKKILLGGINENTKSINDLRILDENNYFDFQNLIRESIGQKPIPAFDPNIDPRLAKIKAKARYRDKIKAKQQGLKLETILTSICCMNLGINPLNIGELSYAAINSLIERYQHKEKYEIDIKSLLAGADSKKIKPEYWIKNFDN